MFRSIVWFATSIFEIIGGSGTEPSLRAAGMGSRRAEGT